MPLPSRLVRRTLAALALALASASVLTAAVVATPDEKWGEVPCAFIEVKDGAAVSEEEIIAFCRQHMARFKVPKKVVFGPLPKTSTGKIQKYLLRQQARSTQAIE